MEARAARSAEREARERANISDLAEFVVQLEKLDEVDAWLRERIAKVTAEADQRRSRHRTAAGEALRAMQDRGESIANIATQAEVAVGKVRHYLKIGETAQRDLSTSEDDDPAEVTPTVEPAVDAATAEPATSLGAA